MSGKLPVAAIAALLVVSGGAEGSGDADRGEFMYSVRCIYCHVPDLAENLTGPHLVGVIGRPAGSVADFEYSAAMRESGLVWNEDTISDFIADPQMFLPGTTMNYPGQRDAQVRADIVAYLKGLAETD
jgi:cytochrome c